MIQYHVENDHVFYVQHIPPSYAAADEGTFVSAQGLRMVLTCTCLNHLYPQASPCSYRYSDVYTCSKNSDCPITLKTRKNCQYCRFARCEKAGMKRSWVLADGDHRNTNKKASDGTGGKSSSRKGDNRAVEKLPTEPLRPLDEADTAKINTYIEKMNLIKNQTEDLNPKVLLINSLVPFGKNIC